MDLSNESNHKMFTDALTACVKAYSRDWLNPAERQFVRDMFEEYKHNGTMFEPTVKQFNWLRQIAIDAG